MTRTQLYLPKSQYEELKQLAQKRGITFAELARELFEEKLFEIKSKRKKHPINQASQLLKSLKDIEKWGGGIRDGSINHDKYLYSDPHNP